MHRQRVRAHGGSPMTAAGSPCGRGRRGDVRPAPRTVGPRTHGRRRMAGLTLPELLVGLAAGSLVVAGALALLSTPLRAATSAEIGARADQDLRAAQRLLARLVREAVPASAGGAGPTVTADGAQLTWHGRGDDGVVRAMAWRFADGQVAMRLDGGGWQAVTDPRVLVLRDGRFTVEGPSAGACGGGAPRVAWSFEARRAVDPQAPWQRVTGLAQVRHPWPVAPGCTP